MLWDVLLHSMVTLMLTCSYASPAYGTHQVFTEPGLDHLYDWLLNHTQWRTQHCRILPQLMRMMELMLMAILEWIYLLRWLTIKLLLRVALLILGPCLEWASPLMIILKWWMITTMCLQEMMDKMIAKYWKLHTVASNYQDLWVLIYTVLILVL